MCIGDDLVLFNVQTAAVAPRFKHSFHNFAAVVAIGISRQVVAIAVTLAHPSFKGFVHVLAPGFLFIRHFSGQRFADRV
nr:hypothetical protein [Escherichia coli]